ncbi:hypothetical protein LXL04_018740 [Taraxacum kok-saghyz]
MLPASHLLSQGVPGHGLSDTRSLRLSTISPCPSCNLHINLPQFNKHTSKTTLSFICNANSSGQRRNPDFSRQNRQGYSRNKNRNPEDGTGTGFEDSEAFTSKNGSSSSSSFLSNPPPKFHSAATPGPREREIVDIFRKVQAQLRERALQKEEKKVEDSQSHGHSKQNETVDSLLKLLRKHSVQHGKTTSTNNRNNNRDFVLNDSSFPSEKETEKEKEKEKDTDTEIQSFRPVSNFQRRSPVPTFKYKTILSGQDEVGPVDSVPEVKMETGTETETETEIETQAEVESDESCDEEEEEEIEEDDLSGMKLVELRALAKSRGIKGMSRMKKQELLELLSS